jgi:opacity protein-like surface antigen
MRAAAIIRTSVALLFCMAAAVSEQAHAQNFEGSGLLRFGVFGQIGSNNFDVNEPYEAEGSVSGASFAGGGTFGYDWLLHSGLIFGIETDLAVDTFNEAFDYRKLHIDYQATLRGRAGVYVHPDVLLYGTAGLSILGVKFDGVFDPVTISRYSKSDSLIGWTVGGGVEYNWHNAIFFGEYLFAGYESFSFSEPVTDGETITRVRNDIDVDQHIFRLGVKFVIGYDYPDYSAGAYTGGCCRY